MIPVDADFNRYQIIVAPVLYMVKEGMKESLEKFVREGGILVTTYMSGTVRPVRQRISRRLSGTFTGNGRPLGGGDRRPGSGAEERRDHGRNALLM